MQGRFPENGIYANMPDVAQLLKKGLFTPKPVRVEILESQRDIEAFRGHVSPYHLQVDLFCPSPPRLTQYRAAYGAGIMPPAAAGSYIDCVEPDIIAVAYAKAGSHHSSFDLDAGSDGLLRDCFEHGGNNAAQGRITGSIQVKHALNPFVGDDGG